VRQLGTSKHYYTLIILLYCIIVSLLYCFITDVFKFYNTINIKMQYFDMHETDILLVSRKSLVDQREVRGCHSHQVHSTVAHVLWSLSLSGISAVANKCGVCWCHHR